MLHLLAQVCGFLSPFCHLSFCSGSLLPSLWSGRSFDVWDTPNNWSPSWTSSGAVRCSIQLPPLRNRGTAPRSLVGPMGSLKHGWSKVAGTGGRSLPPPSLSRTTSKQKKTLRGCKTSWSYKEDEASIVPWQTTSYSLLLANADLHTFPQFALEKQGPRTLIWKISQDVIIYVWQFSEFTPFFLPEWWLYFSWHKMHKMVSTSTGNGTSFQLIGTCRFPPWEYCHDLPLNRPWSQGGTHWATARSMRFLGALSVDLLVSSPLTIGPSGWSRFCRAEVP